MEYFRRLVEALADAVFPPRGHERMVRALSEADILALMTPALVERCTPNAIALLPFRDKSVRALVHEAKYRGNARAQELLARVLAEYLNDWRAEEGALQSGSIQLVPVPLSRKRRAERGFNQCEEVARRALARIPAAKITLDTSVLARPRDTEHQTRLTSLLRRRNLAGAFAATVPADRNALYIVLDDVVTTGATLQAALTALESAGARNIVPLALGH